MMQQARLWLVLAVSVYFLASCAPSTQLAQPTECFEIYEDQRIEGVSIEDAFADYITCTEARND
jgi:hypothetical protein